MIGDMFDITGSFSQNGAIVTFQAEAMMETGTGQMFLPDGVFTTNPTGMGEQNLEVNYVQGTFFRSTINAVEICVPDNHHTPSKAKPPKKPAGYKYNVGSHINAGKAYQLDTHYDGTVNGFVNPNLGQAFVTGRATIEINGKDTDCWLCRRTEIDAEWAVPV